MSIPILLLPAQHFNCTEKCRKNETVSFIDGSHMSIFMEAANQLILHERDSLISFVQMDLNSKGDHSSRKLLQVAREMITQSGGWVVHYFVRWELHKP
jgi:hypothetical protein